MEQIRICRNPAKFDAAVHYVLERYPELIPNSFLLIYKHHFGRNLGAEFNLATLGYNFVNWRYVDPIAVFIVECEKDRCSSSIVLRGEVEKCVPVIV